MSTNQNQIRQRRQKRVRAKISGTTQRPRLAVFRSLSNISAQLIDDTKGVTLVAASSIKSKKSGADAAKEVGATIAKEATTKKISTAIFDRRSYKYHGQVKALAEAAREGGLKF